MKEMKETYERTRLEITEFQGEDVITTSTGLSPFDNDSPFFKFFQNR